MVGLAEGRLGRHLVPVGVEGRGLTTGRLALYAKGRIKGQWLLTLAYDSAKRRADQRLTGAIDPNTYYTVYGDRSERRYDAASTRKLYIKLERRQFYALFGDFQTGFTDTVLGRYVRAATGLKGEYRGARVAASAFAARFATGHRRDEIQGSGLSTGYRLSTRPILANSEQIAIEIRDRLRSEKIVEHRTLTRFVDYDIDYDTGLVRFSSPVLSRDAALNPQFVVADYEVDDLAGDRTIAGARATVAATRALRIGATALRDGDGGTTLGAVDAKLLLGHDTEIRAEVAGSRTPRQPMRQLGAAWLVEAEHHDARFDLLAYTPALSSRWGNGNGAQSRTATNSSVIFGPGGGLTVQQAAGTSLSGNNSDTGEVVASFAQPVTSVTVRYGNAPLTSGESATGQQAIGIAGIGFCPMPAIAIAKTSAPVAGPLGAYNLPGSDVAYTLTVTNTGGSPVDAGAIVLTDVLPSGMTFKNVAGGNGTPFTLAAGTSGVALASGGASYSTDKGATWSYTPAAGYDPGVTGVRVTPTGEMAADSSFAVSFVARVK